MTQPGDISRSWVLGDPVAAQEQSAASLTQDLVVTGVVNDGETQGNMITTRGGRVAWPVDPLTHGGASAIACDAFFAEFIVSEKKAYLLDDDATRHVGAHALEEGINLILPNPITKDSFVIVVRSAEFGTAGIDKNIALSISPKGGRGGSEDIVAHHLPSTPNINSTNVSDPDAAGRKGKIDDVLRVRHYNELNATRAEDLTGATAPPMEFPPGTPEEFAVMLNGAESGVGQNRGHLIVHFADFEARCASTADGPLRAASLKHKQSQTQESNIHAGALDIKALFTDGSESFDSPADFETVEEPDVQEDSGMPVRVHLQMDTDKSHSSILGEREGTWRWHVKIPTIKTPPCKDDYDNSAAAKENGTDRPEAMTGASTGSPVYTQEPMMNVGSDFLAMPGIHKLAR